MLSPCRCCDALWVRRVGRKGLSCQSVCHMAPTQGGWAGVEQAYSTAKNNREETISGCGAKDVYRWVSSINRVNQSAEKGWVGDCCCCSFRTVFLWTDIRTEYLSLVSLAGGVSTKYNLFWGGRWRSYVSLALAKTMLNSLWKTKLPLAFPVLHMMCLCPGLFWKIRKQP